MAVNCKNLLVICDSSSVEEQFGCAGLVRPTAEASRSRFASSNPISPTKNLDPLESELHSILEEVRIITNKIRDEASPIITTIRVRIHKNSLFCNYGWDQ